MEGFVFPNELHVHWGLTIVLYPYITGLVAGAFIVSSLYHVFHVNALKPVARFSLLTALVFLQICPIPLLLHLGRPERNYNILLTPNPTSAMAGFGYIWASYNLMVILENWLAFRSDLVRRAERSRGLVKVLFTVLSLGTKVTRENVEADHRIITVLAAVGIPMACVLHGYVGFLFGGVKANPWWSTPLMPLIFLLSAVVSGIALLLVLYVAVCRVRRVAVDRACLNALIGWLTGFLVIDVTLEMLEVVSMMYEWEESWEVIYHLLSHKLRVTFFLIQLGIGAVLPLVCLTAARTIRENLTWKTVLGVVSGVCVLVGVLAMRVNVVIGGQLFSKSLRGFIHFSPPFLGREGILILSVVFVVPFVALAVICRVLPPWQEEEAGLLPVS